MIEELFTKQIVILGCGNTLLGDDAFGPEVIEQLLGHYTLPETVLALDAGTGAGDILFDLVLSPVRPGCLFLVDAVSESGLEPGTLFELPVDGPAESGGGDFAKHRVPSMNLLRELKHSGRVDVRILAVQAGSIPDFVRPGLSPEVRDAVDRACAWLLREVGGCRARCRS